MFDPIPPIVKRVWDQWNIRGALLFSLSLQTILVLFAPSRKRTSNRLIITMLWSGYLLADAVANFAVGLISNSQTSGSNNKTAPKENPDLLAFWAPFLLLHLGGPDTITAFALEDNALWRRHLLALIIQAVLTGYVFLQTFPTNKVMIPTFIMFLAGIIKYLERTRSLYLASMDRFRDSILKEPDPGPDYANIMREYAKGNAEISAETSYKSEPCMVRTENLKELEIVQNAYGCFNLFKGLIVDLIFSFKERNASRLLFCNIGPEDALRVIEVELNFIYEVLFTKVVVIHSNWGIIFRLLAFSSIVTSLGVFHFHVKKNGYYNGFDVGVTYALLFGAIGLDTVSLLMAIFSDWTVASIDKPDKVLDSRWRVFTDFISRKTKPFFVKFLKFKRSCQSNYKIEPFDYKAEPPLVHTVDYTPFIFRRWSGTVSGYNLLRYCLKCRPEGVYKVRRVNILSKVAKFPRLNLLFGFVHRIINKATKLVGKLLAFLLFRLKQVIKNLRIDTAASRVKDWLIDQVGLKDFIDEMRYSSNEPFTREIWGFICYELSNMEIAGRARGKRIIQENDSKDKNCVEQESEEKKSETGRPDLMPYVVDVSYDESLLLWHVATELLYNTETSDLFSNERLFSKILSDYMLYLLIVQPSMMTSVAGIGKIRYRDTCAEAERFINGSKDLKATYEKAKRIPKKNRPGSKYLKAACEEILGVNTDIKPIVVKGDRSKSVLFDACRLAKELQKLEEKKWEKISRRWVELLSYAASHIRAIDHAQQLGKGGELVSFVWLLMVHIGMGDRFQIEADRVRVKLIVGNLTKEWSFGD